jgi:outer membrane translocation and assembly module TamA
MIRPLSCAILTAVLAVSSARCRHAPPQLTASQPITIDEVRLQGFEGLPVDQQNDLREDLHLRVGAALTDDSETAAGDMAIEVLQNHGYPYAQVRIARETVAPARVRVTIDAEPGTRGFFGPIEIAGNRRVEDRVIRRRVAYLPGDLFTRRAIERSQQRIAALGLFKSVEIRAHGIDTQPAEVPTRITVEERSPWQWNLSLGYAAGEGPGVDARVSHLNLFGAAQRLDLEGRVSHIERTAEVTFAQADTRHAALSYSLQARQQQIDERDFFAVSRGGQATVSWQWTRQFAGTFSYAAALERSSVDAELAILTGLEDGMFSAWSVDLDHRHPAADDTAPSRVLTLHIEQAGGWMPGTFNYYASIGDARHYRRLLDGRLVLAGRARYGAIAPMRDEADIPMLKRFFLGGSGEMRGWGRYEIGPLSESGAVTGGKSLFSTTGEARFAIGRRLNVAAFVEGGHVWQDAWTIQPRSLLYDAGPGLRVDTPFGLIRIDLGYQLNRLEGLRLDGEPEKRRWRLNIGIGEAF